MSRHRLLRILRISLAYISLGASVLTVRLLGQTSSTKLAERPRVLLEVVNRLFTMDMKIPSTYLKVMSDGTIECHAIRFGEKDRDSVKTMQVSRHELAKINFVLSDPRLRDLKQRYELQRDITDSWMEWEININQPTVSLRRNITLAFAGGSGDSSLPVPLRKLGCEILKLRRRVYGEGEGYGAKTVDEYYRPACF